MTFVLDLVHGGERSQALAFHGFEQERILTINEQDHHAKSAAHSATRLNTFALPEKCGAFSRSCSPRFSSSNPRTCCPGIQPRCEIEAELPSLSQYPGQMTQTAVPLTTLVDESTTSEAEGCRKWGSLRIAGLRDT